MRTSLARVPSFLVRLRNATDPFVTVALGASLLSGCITYGNFDAALDSCIGKELSAVRYPALSFPVASRTDQGFVVNEYSIDVLLRCRWEFVTEGKERIVRSWRYPSAEAQRWCHELPTSRP
jgi:hypothetical protein